MGKKDKKKDKKKHRQEDEQSAVDGEQEIRRARFAHG